MPMPSTLVTAGSIFMISVAFFGGVIYKSIGPADKSEADHKNPSSPSKTNLEDMSEYVKYMVQKELQKVQKEIPQTSEVQQYKQGEVQKVITPEMLNDMINNNIQRAMEQYGEQIQEKLDAKLNSLLKLEEKIVEKLEEKGTYEENYDDEKKDRLVSGSEKDIDERLHRIEKLLQKGKSDHFNFSHYLEVASNVISSVTVTIVNITNNTFIFISNTSKWSTLKNPIFKGYLEAIPAHSIVVPTLAVILSIAFDVCFCYCVCRICLRWCKKTKPKNDKGKKITPKTSTFSSDLDIERYRQKLENSLCIVSFSKDFVESCHMPLMKSVMERLKDENLQTKRVVIREPNNLNTIPPSKIFLVFVDFNERNEILEPHLPKSNKLCIKRETVRSLMDSFALVILVYCLEVSSKKLDLGDRFAHKLNKIMMSVKELEELDNKHRFYSVYKEFDSFQLGNLEQTIREYLKTF
ncbi:uncharacterized protein LOC133192364 [Saccostrea echinata]|uniref:uncharacterized protein LOC133192364 n=1 Tax=Saccostrea echinata TaxID=191078 RepID=UPI002A83FB9C|nr:uncharacterized protein LOC133192364 [Saccostrea echinata]